MKYLCLKCDCLSPYNEKEECIKCGSTNVVMIDNDCNKHCTFCNKVLNDSDYDNSCKECE